jgi:hypothetical protein
MEIKFRGQRIDNNEWVYGFYVKTPDGEHRIYWQPFSEASSNTYHFVKPDSIGQMWTLREGISLFTGDLFQAECSIESTIKKEMLCKVTFEPTGMGIVVWQKGCWSACGAIDFTTVRIVGNVVDNPELVSVNDAK